MPDFTKLDYLQHGTDRQQNAFSTLKRHRVFEILEAYNPLLAGTIPLNIDIATSDLDVICCAIDCVEFSATATNSFSALPGFRLKEFQQKDITTTVVNFKLDDFSVELFAQPIPVQQHYAYRHLMIEWRLLQNKGESFRAQIIALKKSGYKTEPAFAHALGLPGDPYEALLAFEQPL